MKWSFLIVLLTGLLFADPAAAQLIPRSAVAMPDTLCLDVETLQQVQVRLQRLEQEAEINEQIIAEQENQIELYRERVRQDSLVIALKDETLELYKQNVGLGVVEAQSDQLQFMKYFYIAGGAVAGFVLGGVIF